MTQSIVCNTPESISYFRLASLKSQLKMEKVGLKSSGGAIRPRIAKEFGLKARDSHDTYISKIQTMMDELLAAQANSGK